ncbi:putative membrane protein [Plasmodium reichenowi]|uniref:Putative membrane protein n=1 Tax=Plasmodium reichenowi TaxID=5854 RepID=A0A151LC59_PLARE|nr:putative membrane protein [Plasmodium reichenowi]KYN96467.1 putative membrane protein [Plasmodium reichenowi]
MNENLIHKNLVNRITNKDDNNNVMGDKSSCVDGEKENEEENEKKENEVSKDKIQISYKSIFLFQIFLFLIYFLVLLIGSFNFSFKLFQVREKHLYEFLNNIKSGPCYNSYYIKKGQNNNKKHNNNNNNNNNINEGKKKRNIVYKNTDNLVHTHDKIPNLNFKYYFTRGKHYKIENNEMKEENNKEIKMFICLNKKQKFYNNDIKEVLLKWKTYVHKFLHFCLNEIKNAFFKKENKTTIQNNMKNYVLDNYRNNKDIEVYKYLYYNFLLNKNTSYKNYYVNMEHIFYMYINNICYYHDFNYIQTIISHNTSNTTTFINIDKNIMEDILIENNKKDITLLINHINIYLNHDIFHDLLNTLYFKICNKPNLINYLKKNGQSNNNTLLNMDNNLSEQKHHNHFDNINYFKYYTLYNNIEEIKNNTNHVHKFLNRIQKNITTVQVLKGLNKCLKKYIRNLTKIPFYFFMDDYYDTPCYVYSKLISNLLRNYYKGIFLYFIIFIGCVHVVFSPFPITLVHFRRFFIYFIIIMYRLFILYFIPSIIQYVIYKFHNFKEEYIHIFDYSDHVILFCTLLFIISLEIKAIEYTIKHQESSSDHFHFKYNRNFCFFFLKFVLYYYYILISFFLYTSYFTSKFFHTTNEIFVAYFFSTFSIFFFFYFFLYKNYFSFYSIGITSYMKKNNPAPSNVFHTPSCLSITGKSLKDKFNIE